MVDLHPNCWFSAAARHRITGSYQNTRRHCTVRLHTVQLAVHFTTHTKPCCVLCAVLGIHYIILTSMCRLVRFPKPQLLMYTLLMVPVIYGAAKLVAAAGSSGDTSAGVACIVLLPLPVLAYWAYVLWIWHTEPLDATRRSKSSIMRAYQRPASAPGIAEGQAAAASQQQRAQATLALLGDLDDNPTLIIRDRRSGEDGLDEIFDRGDHSSSDDGEVERSRLPASRPTASGAGGAAAGTAADGMARVRSQRQVAVSVEARPQQGGSKWRSLASEAGGGSGSGARPAGNASGAGGGSARSSRSMEGSSPGGVLGSRSKVLRAGSPAAPAGEELAPQGGRDGGVAGLRECGRQFAQLHSHCMV